MRRLDRLLRRSEEVSEEDALAASARVRDLSFEFVQALSEGREGPKEDESYYRDDRTLNQWCRQRGLPIAHEGKRLMEEALRSLPPDRLERFWLELDKVLAKTGAATCN